MIDLYCKKRKTVKHRILMIVSLILILLSLLAQIISHSLIAPIEKYDLADRWSSDREYTQVSVFFPGSSGLTVQEFDNICDQIDMTLKNDGMSDINWLKSYSTEDMVSVVSDDIQINASVTAVGGDFFQFHPLSMLSGSCFWESDVNDNLVVVDESLAWKLFGSCSLEGMSIQINGSEFIIAGVCSEDKSFGLEEAYGENPRLYMKYSAYQKLKSNTDDTLEEKTLSGAEALDSNTSSAAENEEKITSVQILLPNTVSGYASQIVTDVLEGYDGISIIENTKRFTFLKLWQTSFEIASRSMKQNEIIYPYWENAARLAENYGAVLLWISLSCLVLPFILMMIMLHKLIQNLRAALHRKHPRYFSPHNSNG